MSRSARRRRPRRRGCYDEDSSLSPSPLLLPRPDPLIRQPLPPGRTTDVAARRTLVLAPHFDDEVLGCGGLIRKLADDGAAVQVLFLTDGSGGVEQVDDRAAYSERRRAEAELATKVLGCVGLEVLEIRDGALSEGRAEAAAAIRRALLEQRPGLVLVPSPLEVTDDHRAAFDALYDVLSPLRESAAHLALAPDFEVWLYDVNHPGYPDLLVDVSDCRVTLERAMAIYASQEERHPYLQAAIGLRQFRTHTLGPQVALAEGFRRLVPGDFAAQSLAALVADLGGSADEELSRLEELIREMQGTRAWRMHRFVERVRGR